MADQFDAFQKEVEEDLQRERLQKLWEQYGTFAIGAAAALVLGVAAWKFMDNRRIATAESNSIKYVAAVRALAENKADDGQTALGGMASTQGGYGLLARLRLAGSEAAAGKTDKAFAAYEAIAREPGIDRVMADYARLQAALLKIDSSEWTETRTRLIELTADSNPWKHKAREALGFAAYRTANLTEARAEFQRLVADPTTPPSISERANIVMADIVQAELAKTQAGGAGGTQAGGAQNATTPQQPAPKSAPETPGTKKK